MAVRREQLEPAVESTEDFDMRGAHEVLAPSGAPHIVLLRGAPWCRLIVVRSPIRIRDAGRTGQAQARGRRGGRRRSEYVPAPTHLRGSRSHPMAPVIQRHIGVPYPAPGIGVRARSTTVRKVVPHVFRLFVSKYRTIYLNTYRIPRAFAHVEPKLSAMCLVLTQFIRARASFEVNYSPVHTGVTASHRLGFAPLAIHTRHATVMGIVFG